MESFKHPWKIPDFEMDVVTRWDIGLPSLGRSKCVLGTRGKVKRYLMAKG